MSKVWIVEGDNDMDYSDHHNWFVCAAKSLKAAEQYILENKATVLYYADEYMPETEHLIPQEKDSKTHFIWNFTDGRKSYSSKVILYIYQVEVYSPSLSEKTNV